MSIGESWRKMIRFGARVLKVDADLLCYYGFWLKNEYETGILLIVQFGGYLRWIHCYCLGGILIRLQINNSGISNIEIKWKIIMLTPTASTPKRCLNNTKEDTSTLTLTP